MQCQIHISFSELGLEKKVTHLVLTVSVSACALSLLYCIFAVCSWSSVYLLDSGEGKLKWISQIALHSTYLNCSVFSLDLRGVFFSHHWAVLNSGLNQYGWACNQSLMLIFLYFSFSNSSHFIFIFNFWWG